MSHFQSYRAGSSIFNALMVTALGAGCAVLFAASSWADCQSSYHEAMALLDSTTQKASQNEHPSPETFSAEFKSIVGTMQAQKCMPELMSLIQHIQSEQQKIPSDKAAEQDKNAPITD